MSRSVTQWMPAVGRGLCWNPRTLREASACDSGVVEAGASEGAFLSSHEAPMEVQGSLRPSL